MLISIVVPCYNEADNVEKLKNELIPVARDLISSEGINDSNDNNVEIVFVDDGSRDNTYQKLIETFGRQEERNLIYKFERHPQNRGLGAALRTGFRSSCGDVVLTLDSDGTYSFSEIPELLSYLTNDVDVVTASPYHPKGRVDGVPAFRLLLSKGSSLIYRILLDWRIHTYTSLFRVYRSEVIKSVVFESDGYLAGTELMVKAILSGYRVIEFPTVLYRRMFGVSKAKIVRTIIAHLQFQARLLLHRLGIHKLI